MKKVAILFSESLNDRKGAFNAVVNRVRYLMQIADFEIDVFLLQNYEPLLARTLRGTPKVEKVKDFSIDGKTVPVWWYDFSILDFILLFKLGTSTVFYKRFLQNKVERFRDYDLILAHSTSCGYLAMKIKERFAIPFAVSWHGSDIHTVPYQSRHIMKCTQRVLKAADCNFFVSKSLERQAHNLCSGFVSEVLYNGVSSAFHPYSPTEKMRIRGCFGVETEKVVCFAGNFFDVKNVTLLPTIFRSVASRYKGNVTFWLVGDGYRRKEVEADMQSSVGLKYLFWGNQPSTIMPDIFNCIDVLVLPSKNEGFGLVAAEALACGANAVGSNVGGIPEILGAANVFDLGDMFVELIATRIVEMLEAPVEQPLAEKFRWEKTADAECRFCHEIKKITRGC